MNLQPDLLSWEQPIRFAVEFKGGTFNPSLDSERLNGQQKRVHDVMLDAGWLTLREIADRADCPEASASARFRDFRNDEYLTQFFISESRRLPGADRSGIWQYRLSRR